MDLKNEKCVMVIDHHLTPGCKTYKEFIEKMGQIPESSLQYLGIAVCGAKKNVNKLTGSMPLLQ